MTERTATTEDASLEGGDGSEMSGPGGGPRAGNLHRQVAREAYERRLASLSQADLAATAEDERRLRAIGVQADLVGIAPETTADLVDEWERLARAYPRAMEYWRLVGPDVELTRLDPMCWLGYGSGMVLWNPMPLGRDAKAVVAALRRLSVSGDHPEGYSTVPAMGCHEFGHAAEEAVRKALGDEQWRRLQGGLVACSISGYAVKYPEECFAVAFAALHHASGSRPNVARAVALLEETLSTLRG